MYVDLVIKSINERKLFAYNINSPVINVNQVSNPWYDNVRNWIVEAANDVGNWCKNTFGKTIITEESFLTGYYFLVQTSAGSGYIN